MTITQKAKQIIENNYNRNECLEMHKANNYETVIRFLESVEFDEFLNSPETAKQLVARDAIQNIVLENFTVENNQIEPVPNVKTDAKGLCQVCHIRCWLLPSNELCQENEINAQPVAETPKFKGRIWTKPAQPVEADPLTLVSQIESGEMSVVEISNRFSRENCKNLQYSHAAVLKDAVWKRYQSAKELCDSNALRGDEKSLSAADAWRGIADDLLAVFTNLHEIENQPAAEEKPELPFKVVAELKAQIAEHYERIRFYENQIAQLEGKLSLNLAAIEVLSQGDDGLDREFIAEAYAKHYDGRDAMHEIGFALRKGWIEQIGETYYATRKLYTSLGY